MEQAAQEEAPTDLLSAIASALEHGQQKKLLSLCQQALDQGYSPDDILSKGMVKGMSDLGDAFSANRPLSRRCSSPPGA